MPAISVIVPVYNVEKYLRRCINSILNQTFSDFELILIDDGSTDSSGRICDEYALSDARTIVKHITNGGVSNARNVALDIATGKFIAFCDSDDYFHTDMLMEMHDAIKLYNTDLVSCDFYTFDDKKIVCKSDCCNNNKISFADSREKTDYIITKFLLGQHGWEIWHHLFRSDIIKNNNIKFLLSCNNFAEDLAFVFEYLLHTKSIFMLNKCLYYYYLRENSMMRNNVDIIKLNELNEVAYSLEKKFKSIFPDKKNIYALISFLILNNQYQKIISSGNYMILPDEIKKITNQKWYKKQLFTILKYNKQFNKYFKKSVVQRIVLFSTFCIHRNWKIYKLFSGIYYKFIYKED